MKKLLCLIAPVFVISSCGEEIKPRDYIGYGFTNGGALSFAKVHADEERIIKTVEIDETISIVDSSKRNVEFVTKNHYDTFLKNAPKDYHMTVTGSSTGDCIYLNNYKFEETPNSRSAYIIVKKDKVINSKTMDKELCTTTYSGKWLEPNKLLNIYIENAELVKFKLLQDQNTAPIYDYDKVVAKSGDFSVEGRLTSNHLYEAWAHQDNKVTIDNKTLFKSETYIGDWFKPYFPEEAGFNGWTKGMEYIKNYFLEKLVAKAKVFDSGTQGTFVGNVTGATLSNEYDYIRLVRRALSSW